LGSFDGAKVFFSPCGIGLGHVGRVLPVAEELVRRGAEVMFSTYLEGVDFVRERGFPVVSAPALSLDSDSTGSICAQPPSLRGSPPSVGSCSRSRPRWST
jgi:predicted glycosyltransferase